MQAASPAPKARSPSGAYPTLVLVSIIATFVLVVLGGVVRVTGSGLGCPDWPLCHGSVIPPLNLPTLIEYSHRLAASLVSLLVLATAIVAWTARRNDRPVALAASIAFALLVAQVVLGGVTVLMELPPTIVTAHLATAEALLGVLTVLYILARRHEIFASIGARRPSPGLLWMTGAAVLSIFAIIFAGAYVRGTGATFACDGWPFCGPELLPESGLPAIHMAHRLVVLVGGVLAIVACVAAWRQRRALPGGGPLAVATGVLFLLQTLAGAWLVFSEFTPFTQALHLTLATAVWTGIVALAGLAWYGRLSHAEGIPAEAEARHTNTVLPGIVALATLAWYERQSRPEGAPALQPPLMGYVKLVKPWIIGLLLFTALGGMFLAAGGAPPLGVVVAVLVGGALTAGGANALNHYIDRDIDGLMYRTRARPIPSHRISPERAFMFGIALNVVGFLVLAVGANPLSAVLALAASGFYVLVYTSWLKRTTPQNIVIGGAAGAMPPLIGWAAITNSLGLPGFYLFAIVFFWTPPHFWALAMLLRDDYARAGIPMLPVVRSERETVWSILLYTIVLVAVTLLLYSTQALGTVYLASALVFGGLFIWMAVRLLKDSQRPRVAGLYKYSLLYLALLFVAIIADKSIGV
ncbi:MAG: heme o synthase [Dehalococcoidia bacterium]|nr:heme o synthase [Dehalococcoidia bacterium]